MTRENTVNVPTQSLCDWDAFEDDISDVINDSIDMDWNSLHGARAVLDWLNGKAPYAAPLHEGDWSDLERLARAAGGQQWHQGKTAEDQVMALDEDGRYVAAVKIIQTGGGTIAAYDEARRFANAQYLLAANPATILKLIASARSAPLPSVEVFGSSSLKGEDTHRAPDMAVLASLVAAVSILEEAYSRKLSPNKVVGSDKMFCQMLTDYNRAIAKGRQAAVRTAEQVGASEASEPKPSVEVERLREALRFYLLSDDDGSVAHATLSRKQEPGVPTPGGEGE